MRHRLYLKEECEEVCNECEYPLCGGQCGDSETHHRECSILKDIHSKNYAVVSVVRLLLLKNEDTDNWNKIGNTKYLHTTVTQSLLQNN